MEVPAFPMPAAAANRKLHDFLAKMEIQRKWWESKNQEPHGSHPFCPWFCMLVWRSSTRGSDFPFPSWIMAHDQWHLLSISRGKIRSCGMAFFRKWNLPIHLGNKPILYRLSISLPLLNSRLKSPRVWVQSLKEEHVLLKYVEIKTHMVLGHACELAQILVPWLFGWQLCTWVYPKTVCPCFLIEIDIMVHITLGSRLKTIVLSLFHGFHADGFLQTFTKHHYKVGPP